MKRPTHKKSSLQVIRESKGLTRVQCARWLDVSLKSWERWEVGHHPPTAANLMAIAAFLEVPASHLFDITQPRTFGKRRNPTGPGQLVQEDPT